MLRVDCLQQRITEAVAVLEGLRGPRLEQAIDQIAQAVVVSLEGGGRVLLCGNGGSSADAQHLAAELVGRFYIDRRPLSAIALGDNVAALTAIGNDYSYAETFVRPLLAFGRQGDILIALSTSGRSKNVLAALTTARQVGITTVAFVGQYDLDVRPVADYVVQVEAANTARVQEAHKLLGHILFEIVEREVCAT